MCRIVSFVDFNFNNFYSLEETIIFMRDTLFHGGPDDAGIFIDKDFPVAVGTQKAFHLRPFFAWTSAYGV